MSIIADRLHTTFAGERIPRFSIQRGGTSMRVIALGATITDFMPGESVDSTLGFDTPDAYSRNPTYFGCVVGRVANRIAGGRFTLNDRSYQLGLNDGLNHLHGGAGGFHRRVWQTTEHAGTDQDTVELRYSSIAGEEGYPGELDVIVRYTLDDSGALTINYEATTDETTIVNLTNHTYFNLAGTGTVDNQLVQINAARYLPTDANQIPTGELRAVDGTPFDLRTPTAIGAAIAHDDEQLRFGFDGFDHCWVRDTDDGSLWHAATLHDPASGRRLHVDTTAPGLQCYTGNHLAGTVGRDGAVYPRRGGICFESQGLPNAINTPGFPSIVLAAGTTYKQTTRWRFDVQ